MQVKTQHGSLQIGGKTHQHPAISVAIAPKSPPGHLITGLVLGGVFGFVVGSVATLMLGNKSLLLVQHLWNRLTGVNEDGEHVHFELLLQ